MKIVEEVSKGRSTNKSDSNSHAVHEGDFT
jgi:hypothetical protein